MSTDLDLYPFKAITVLEACESIKKYFVKFSGLMIHLCELQCEIARRGVDLRVYQMTKLSIIIQI